MEVTVEELGEFFATVMPHLGEVQRRVVAGAMARGVGRGGKTKVAEASGLSRNTVIKAQAEVEVGIEPGERQRLVGGGDKPAIEKQPGLLEALDGLVHPTTRGTPMSLLRWTLKSTYELSWVVADNGSCVDDVLVGYVGPPAVAAAEVGGGEAAQQPPRLR